MVEIKFRTAAYSALTYGEDMVAAMRGNGIPARWDERAHDVRVEHGTIVRCDDPVDFGYVYVWRGEKHEPGSASK